MSIIKTIKKGSFEEVLFNAKFKTTITPTETDSPFFGMDMNIITPRLWFKPFNWLLKKIGRHPDQAVMIL